MTLEVFLLIVECGDRGKGGVKAEAIGCEHRTYKVE